MIVVHFCVFLFLTSICIAQSKVDFYSDLPLNKSIYAFGESAHGNAKEYDLKYELIKKIGEKGDSINVYIEMPFISQVYIDSFFRNEISEEILVKNMRNFHHRTTSFVEFLKSLKRLKRIRVYGIDMQVWETTYNFLRQSILNKDSSLRYSEKMDLLRLYLQDGGGKLTNHERSDFRKIIEELRVNFKNDNSSNFNEIDYGLNILEQYFGYKNLSEFSNASVIKYRDSCMANNVMYLHNKSVVKGVVLAANFHTFRFQSPMKNMGFYISKSISSSDYFVICSQFLEGTVLSRKLVSSTLTNVIYKVPILKNSVSNYIFNNWGDADKILIVLENSRSNSRKFNRIMNVQDFGAGDTDNLNMNYRKLRLSKICDAILYHKIAYASKPM